MAYKQVPGRDGGLDPEGEFPTTSAKMTANWQFAYVVERVQRTQDQGTPGESYRVRFYDTDRTVTRHVSFMQKRINREALFERFGAEDPLGRRARPGEDAARPGRKGALRRQAPLPITMPTRIMRAVPTDPRHRRTGREPEIAVPVAASLACMSR